MRFQTYYAIGFALFLVFGGCTDSVKQEQERIRQEEEYIKRVRVAKSGIRPAKEVRDMWLAVNREERERQRKEKYNDHVAIYRDSLLLAKHNPNNYDSSKLKTESLKVASEIALHPKEKEEIEKLEKEDQRVRNEAGRQRKEAERKGKYNGLVAIYRESLRLATLNPEMYDPAKLKTESLNVAGKIAVHPKEKEEIKKLEEEDQRVRDEAERQRKAEEERQRKEKYNGHIAIYRESLRLATLDPKKYDSSKLKTESLKDADKIALHPDEKNEIKELEKEFARITDELICQEFNTYLDKAAKSVRAAANDVDLGIGTLDRESLQRAKNLLERNQTVLNPFRFSVERIEMQFDAVVKAQEIRQKRLATEGPTITPRDNPEFGKGIQYLIKRGLLSEKDVNR